MITEKMKEEQRFQERSYFIKKFYPGDEEKRIEIINTELDGLEVLERRDDAGNLIAIRTYQFSKDPEGEVYCQLGVSLVDEEERGMGVAYELFLKLKELAEERGATYMTAMADTEDGKEFLERQGFNIENDLVTGAEYYHLDL